MIPYLFGTYISRQGDISTWINTWYYLQIINIQVEPWLDGTLNGKCVNICFFVRRRGIQIFSDQEGRYIIVISAVHQILSFGGHMEQITLPGQLEVSLTNSQLNFVIVDGSFYISGHNLSWPSVTDRLLFSSGWDSFHSLYYGMIGFLSNLRWLIYKVLYVLMSTVTAFVKLVIIFYNVTMWTIFSFNWSSLGEERPYDNHLESELRLFLLSHRDRIGMSLNWNKLEKVSRKMFVWLSLSPKMPHMTYFWSAWAQMPAPCVIW